MNQATNRIQYGLLTEEEKAQFLVAARGRAMYEFFHCEEWNVSMKILHFKHELVYRLKIVPDEWYYIDGAIKMGYHIGFGADKAKVLRPALPEEIPAEEIPAEDFKVRIQEQWPDKRVEMLEYKYPIQVLMLCDGGPDNYIEHYQAQSRKSFMGYVFKNSGGNFFTATCPIAGCGDDPIHPVAVLFEKGADDE